MGRDIFISYRSEDKEWAERICSALEHESLSCWIAPRDIDPGKKWATAIVENLRNCKAFVIVLSSNVLNAAHKLPADSEQAQDRTRHLAREVELADQNGLPIITVRVEDVQPPEDLVYFMGNVQWLDAFGGRFDTAMAQLVQALRAIAEGQSAPAAVAAAQRVTKPAPAKSGSAKWLAAGAAAVLVIAAIVWLALKQHDTGGNEKQTQTTNTAKLAAAPTNTSTGADNTNVSGGGAADTATAKSIADQFMARVQAEDVKGAWTMTSRFFKQHQKQFQENVGSELKQDGGATGVTSKNCVYDGNDTYRCFYTLKTKAKEKDATVTVVKSNSWQVQHFTLTG